MVQRVFYVYFKLLINNIIYYFILIGGEGGIRTRGETYIPRRISSAVH